MVRTCFCAYWAEHLMIKNHPNFSAGFDNCLETFASLLEIKSPYYRRRGDHHRRSARLAFLEDHGLSYETLKSKTLCGIEATRGLHVDRCADLRSLVPAEHCLHHRIIGTWSLQTQRSAGNGTPRLQARPRTGSREAE